MAGYLGYALKAGVEGFQTGMNLAQKKTEMEWQKKQKKKLEEKEAKFEEEAILYNSVVTQAGADGLFSEDDVLKITTTYLALSYWTQERLKSAHDALLTMNKDAFDREMDQFDSITELLKSGLLDPKDATALFDYSRENFATSEKIESLYEAADNIYAKTHGEVQKEKELEITKYLPEEYRYPHLKEAGIVGEITPTETTKAPTYNEKRFNWKVEQVRLGRMTLNQLLESEGVKMSPEEAKGLEKQVQDIRTEGERAGIDPAKIDKAIQDKILGTQKGALTPTPTSVESLREDIKNAPTIEDARRMEKNHIAKYGDTLDIPNIDKFWSDERVSRLTTLKQGIDKLLDEKKRLKKGTITSAEVGFEIEDDIQKVEAVYQQLREEYMKYRKMLEKMGVDLSQFPELMSYEEYLRTDIKPGKWPPAAWGKQKPAVY